MVQCPYCKNDMKKGFVEGDGRNNIIWVEESEKRNFLDNMLGKKCVMLAKREIWVRSSVDAYYCEGCKKVIIDVPDNEED